LIQEHVFQPRDLVAGHLALDLVNTVTARNAEPVEWLTGYPRLLQWASLTGEFDPGALHALHRLSADAPAAATAALHATRELREALHDVTSAIIRNDPPPADGPGSRTSITNWPCAQSSYSGTCRSRGPASARVRAAAGCSSTTPEAASDAGATWPPAVMRPRPPGTTNVSDNRTASDLHCWSHRRPAPASRQPAVAPGYECAG